MNPGGAAQAPHRDYHLGFMPDSAAAQFPAHVHGICPKLTLQGAVAHVDMPVEAGATMFLPFSQMYRHGYLCWRRDEFKDYFAAHQVPSPPQPYPLHSSSQFLCDGVAMLCERVLGKYLGVFNRTNFSIRDVSTSCRRACSQNAIVQCSDVVFLCVVVSV